MSTNLSLFGRAFSNEAVLGVWFSCLIFVQAITIQMVLQSVPKQGLLGVIKSALEQEPAAHPASELPKLFSSQPFTVPAMQPSDLSKTDSLGLDIDLEIGKLLVKLVLLNSSGFKYILYWN